MGKTNTRYTNFKFLDIQKSIVSNPKSIQNLIRNLKIQIKNLISLNFSLDFESAQTMATHSSPPLLYPISLCNKYLLKKLPYDISLALF